MTHSLPDLCDAFGDQLHILEPLFRSFGGRSAFHGEIVTVKCFEDNSLVKSTLALPGEGRVLVVDGGGSLRCALLGDQLAAMGAENDWHGVLVNGCVRDVEITRNIHLGIYALAPCPVRSEKRGEGQQGTSVWFAGTYVHPGHWLYADDNGIAISDKNLNVDFADR